MMKDRKITLKIPALYNDVEKLSYKLSEVSIQDQTAKDGLAADVESKLDGTIVTRLMNLRNAILRKRLTFCLKKEEILEIDDTLSIRTEYVYELVLPDKFDDNQLETIMTLMHEYIVRGTLLDWYRKCGTNFGEGLALEVDDLESKIVDCLRSEIVRHPSLPYIQSYRTR